MKNRIRQLIAAGAVMAFSIPFLEAQNQGEERLLKEQQDFYNLIRVKNVPAQARDYNLSVFSDLGAWSGYALPENESDQYAGAFIGPMSMTGGWVAATLSEPELIVDGKRYDLARNIQTSLYQPGKLVQNFNNGQIHVITELCFATSRSVIVRTTMQNVGSASATVSMHWKGGVFDKQSLSRQEGNRVLMIRKKDSLLTATHFQTADKVMLLHNDSLKVIEKESLSLKPGEIYQAVYVQSVLLRGDDWQKEFAMADALNVESSFKMNTIRWNANISALLSDKKVSANRFLSKNDYRKVLVKAMMTLNSNWRTAAGDLKHDGSYPSYNEFYGFWSWDSWKIASGNVFYNPEMAKNEMRTLFDYQAKNGMIPDFIGYNKAHNNWRDSKPPLAAWGVMNIFEQTGDTLFVKEMFDKLCLFHQWWYKERDHDHNGVCEYGSTDGTLIAAAWESGMDNGVRFDDTKLLKNGDNAWSMNQENICLNSFLYVEKTILAKMAALLNHKELARQFDNDAKKLKEYIQTRMYDKTTGSFYDVRLGTGEFVKIMGAECWLPLWAGIATTEQARTVKDVMMNPSRFNSYLPLGTLDVSDSHLKPVAGYWRGPVWVDQVYFGITGLRNYGFEKEADLLTEKFVNHAYGLLSDGPIHENYNPLTGEVLNCPNFGWSSALIIKMLLKN